MITPLAGAFRCQMPGRAYAAASNRLATSVDSNGTFNAAHDAFGNMLAMPGLDVMQWDVFGNLHRTSADDTAHGDKTFYVYDAAGQRVRKVSETWDGSLDRFVRSADTLYLGGFELVRTWTGTDGETLVNEIETLHVTDADARLAIVETQTVENGTANPQQPKWRYNLDDLIGSSAVELGRDGQVISYEEFHAYGTTALLIDKGGEGFRKRYRWSGKERDAESGLVYFGARYFAPWLGRWASADPAGAVDGNPYRVVRGNPSSLREVDGREGEPTGRPSRDDIWATESTPTSARQRHADENVSSGEHASLPPTPEETAAVQTARNQFDALSPLIARRYPLATAAFRHYLDGSGQPVQMSSADVDDLLARDDAHRLRSRVETELSDVLAEFERSLAHQPLSREGDVLTLWGASRGRTATFDVGDAHYAFGGVQLSVLVRAEFVSTGREWVMTEGDYSVQLIDPYDWATDTEGKGVGVEELIERFELDSILVDGALRAAGLRGGRSLPENLRTLFPEGEISDAHVGRLHRLGLARDYDRGGTSSWFELTTRANAGALR